jgi:hypothetical protein
MQTLLEWRLAPSLAACRNCFNPGRTVHFSTFHWPQSDVKCLWNKGPAIWFPKVGPGTAATFRELWRLGPMHIETRRG